MTLLTPHPSPLTPNSSPLTPQLTKGFTLVELLVALAIFAVMAVVAYRGLSVMLDARERIEQENRKWRGMAVFFARLENDLGSVLERPVRGTSDLLLPAFSGKPVAVAPDEAQLAFTRGGYGGQDGALAVPQRVGYRLRGEAVELLTWEVLDQAPRSSPLASAALSGVTQFDLRYLDRNGNWLQQWPPGGQDGGLPSAVEVRVRLRGGEEARRVFALPL